MIINNKYKFIFIHVPKTAGTSISHALSHLEGNVPAVCEYHEDFAGFHKHRRIKDFKLDEKEFKLNGLPLGMPANMSHLLDFPFEDYFKFSFVRNHWSRVFSGYCWLHEFGKDHAPNAKPFQPYKSHFEEFIKGTCCEKENIPYSSKYFYYKYYMSQPISYTQTSFFEIDNSNVMDFIGRHENLPEDLKKIYDLIGIEEGNRLKLIHKNRSRSNSENYKDYYSEYTRKLVADKFHEDIEKFDYTF